MPFRKDWHCQCEFAFVMSMTSARNLKHVLFTFCSNKRITTWPWRRKEILNTMLHDWKHSLRDSLRETYFHWFDSLPLEHLILLHHTGSTVKMWAGWWVLNLGSPDFNQIFGTTVYYLLSIIPTQDDFRSCTDSSCGHEKWWKFFLCLFQILFISMKRFAR